KIRDLRYGENPHQRAAWYSDPGALLSSAIPGAGPAFRSGDARLSYTNLLDLDAAARIVLEFDEPAAAVIKHTNPCGAAIGASIAEAYVRARDADPVSAFGGIIGLNRPIDLACAEAIASTRVDAVIAPAVDEAAKPVLAKKTNMRVVVADFSGVAQGLDVRSILGAMLLQETDVVPQRGKPGGG